MQHGSNMASCRMPVHDSIKCRPDMQHVTCAYATSDSGMHVIMSHDSNVTMTMPMPML